MSSYIVERRQEEKDRRRADIVAAAESLYREIGWDAVTMDSVARHARLSRALVYVYFKDKRELHFAIAGRAMDVLLERFAEASARSRVGLEKVEAMGRAYLAFSQEFGHYFDAFARTEMHAPDVQTLSPQEMASIAASTRVHEAVVSALAAGQQDGSIRSDLGDLHVTSRVLWGFMHGIVQIAATKGRLLALEGVSVMQLTQHASTLLRSMLGTRHDLQ